MCLIFLHSLCVACLWARQFLQYLLLLFPPSLFAELAQAVVDAGSVQLLVLCLQEPEISLKRISASALSDIAKHSPEVTHLVVYACIRVRTLQILWCH